jgi:hypothetical protein
MSSSEGDKVIRSKIGPGDGQWGKPGEYWTLDCGTRGEAVGDKLINIIRRDDS